MVRYDELALNYMTTLVTDPRLLLLPARKGSGIRLPAVRH